MSAVRFWMFGREFSLACDDGQEPRLHFLVARLKERVEAITAAAQGPTQRGTPAQMEILVMAAVTFADEFQDAREALSQIQEAFQPGDKQANGPSAQALAELANRQKALQQRLAQMEARLENMASSLASPAENA